MAARAQEDGVTASSASTSLPAASRLDPGHSAAITKVLNFKDFSSPKTARGRSSYNQNGVIKAKSSRISTSS